MAKKHLTEVGQLGQGGARVQLLPMCDATLRAHIQQLQHSNDSVVEGLLSCQVHNRGGPLRCCTEHGG